MKIITPPAFTNGLRVPLAPEASPAHFNNLMALRRSLIWLALGVCLEQALSVGVLVCDALSRLGLTLLAWGLIAKGAWGTFFGSFETLLFAWSERDKARHAAELTSESLRVTAGSRVHAALARLPRRDLLGRYCPWTPVGRSEALLEGALIKAGFCIARDLQPGRGVIIPQYELLELGWGDWGGKQTGAKNYVADFAYIHPGLNLHLDIEIDEMDKGERGRRRDQVFLERGWLVVRVTEAEVSLDSIGVARVLRELVAAIEADNAAAVERLLARAA
ncbi:MAG: hypothetical protein VKP62_02990 [Candidatus Sericytochromatia bacterium]|nr:hypothetical protein [Candidatus Sericytochromatia bacterium]